MSPVYLEKLTVNELQERAEKLISLQNECRICPRECLARRHEGECGDCHCSNEVMISSVSPHFGEEAPLEGTHGSGTIFFSFCNLN